MANYGTRYQKKETPYGVFLFILVVFLIMGYFLSGLYNLTGSDMIFNEKIKYLITHSLSCWNEKTPAVMIAALIAWLIAISYYQYYYRNFQMEMEHGDARWLDAAAAMKELADRDEKYNRIVSENLKVSLRGVLSNNNMLIIGNTGCGKTTALMHQNLLQMNSAYVVLDVKGDTQRKLGRAMIEGGYYIGSLNFKQPQISDRWNPFVYIEREDDMLRIIKALHEACRPRNSMSAADPFWDDAVDLYLQALFYFVWLDAKEKGKVGSMNDVLRLCNLETQTVPRGEAGVSKLQLLMEEKEAVYGPEYPPVRDYFKLKDGAPDTVRSVILMINGMLSICETAEVKRIFSGNDFNIRDIGRGVGGDPKKPMVLFLVIPDNNNVYNWIISMFYTQMFDILIRLSDDELKAPLPIPVEVWMDEFYAGARPADPDVLLGVVRSRNISMIPILQSVSQIKTLYKDSKWEVITDNTATVVYLGSGPTAETTHKWISDLLGETTADSRTDNLHVGPHGNSGLNFAKAGIKLMTPEQVKRMPQTECIVFLEGRPPVYDRKAFPFDRPAVGYTAEKFFKDRYAKALALGPYEHPVHTVYDPVHFKYITVEREKTLQIIEDEDEIRTYLEAAKRDPDIYMFDIDEKDILYLSWGQPERTKEEVEQLLREALTAQNRRIEELKGLSVLQEVDGVPEFGTQDTRQTDKSSWEIESSLKSLLDKYWSELPLEEQEEICLALDDGLTEAQICKLMYLSLEEMVTWHRAFKLQNAKG